MLCIYLLDLCTYCLHKTNTIYSLIPLNIFLYPTYKLAHNCPQILRVLCLWLMEGETKCVEKARSLLKHLYPEGHSGFPLTVWGQELVTCSHVGARRFGKCSPGLGSHLRRNSPTQRKRNTCSDQQLGISASNTKGREIHLVVIEMCMNEVGLHEDTEDH